MPLNGPNINQCLPTTAMTHDVILIFNYLFSKPKVFFILLKTEAKSRLIEMTVTYNFVQMYTVQTHVHTLLDRSN